MDTVYNILLENRHCSYNRVYAALHF